MTSGLKTPCVAFFSSGLLLIGCADIGMEPVAAPWLTPGGQASPIRRAIDVQMRSQHSEEPPEPVPGREAEALGALPPLSGRRVPTPSGNR